MGRMPRKHRTAFLDQDSFVGMCPPNTARGNTHSKAETGGTPMTPGAVSNHKSSSWHRAQEAPPPALTVLRLYSPSRALLRLRGATLVSRTRTLRVQALSHTPRQGCEPIPYLPASPSPPSRPLPSGAWNEHSGVVRTFLDLPRKGVQSKYKVTPEATKATTVAVTYEPLRPQINTKQEATILSHWQVGHRPGTKTGGKGG